MLAKVVRIATVAPAVALTGWLLVGLPLLLAHRLSPALTVTCAIVVTIPALTLIGMNAPFTPENQSERDIHSALPLLLMIAVAAGFGAVGWTTSSEHVVVRRDPGVYAQSADWLAHHGRLPVPTQAGVFGAAPGLRYGSPGFYQRGDHVVPQFMSGTSIALAPAGWAAGLRGITRADAVIGALALLAVAGLAARLAGAWAGALTAVALALAYPDLQQARSAFSEPSAQLLLFGGLSLLVDAHRRPRGPARTWASGLAGLVIGMVALVRIDALVELIAFVPVVAVLTMRGRVREALATSIGVVIGVALALIDGLFLARPYLATLRHELRLSAAAAVAVVVLTLLAMWAWRRGALRRVPYRDHLADLAAVTVALVAIAAYFLRPHLSHPQYKASDPASGDVVALQAHLGLPAYGPRTYAEQSMHWLAWWIGPSGLALGMLALVLLVRRVLRGRDEMAMPFLFVVLGATAVVLARPSITPDHPWADRRFVPVVLPGLVVAASWLVARAARWTRERNGRTITALVAVLGSAALIAPALVGALPLLGRRTERGEIGAVARVCASLPARAAVLVTGARASEEWPQLLHGDCGVPVAVVTGDHAADTTGAAAANARSRGWQPVVVSDSRTAATAVGAHDVTNVVHLLTREADHQLVQRPTRTRAVTIELWAGAAP